MVHKLHSLVGMIHESEMKRHRLTIYYFNIGVIYLEKNYRILMFIVSDFNDNREHLKKYIYQNIYLRILIYFYVYILSMYNLWGRRK